jgi:hypothetical protein
LVLGKPFIIYYVVWELPLAKVRGLVFNNVIVVMNGIMLIVENDGNGILG